MLRQFEEENEKGNLPTGSFPVTVDVTALYTNIRAEGPDGGFQAFEKALETRSDKTIPTSFLMDLLKATINGNIFEFDDQLWRQVIGTAMGTRIAPTYACLYMSYFETEKILKTWTGTPPKMFKTYSRPLQCDAQTLYFRLREGPQARRQHHTEILQRN